MWYYLGCHCFGCGVGGALAVIVSVDGDGKRGNLSRGIYAVNPTIAKKATNPNAKILSDITLAIMFVVNSKNNTQ